jgi:hypothetical protein
VVGSRTCTRAFEGTLQVNLPLFDAPPWNACADTNPEFAGSLSTPDIYDVNQIGSRQAPLAPTDQMTYFGLGMYQLISPGTQHEYVSQQLCAPLLAGHTYAFTINLASFPITLSAAPARGPAQLAVYDSTSDCSREELLWTSPVVGTDWTNVCATLTPTKDYNFLTLEPTGPDEKEGAYIVLDHLVPVEKCP